MDKDHSTITIDYGWVYRKYCKEAFCDDWLDLEKQALNAGIGLWKDNTPQPPWEWTFKRITRPISTLD